MPQHDLAKLKNAARLLKCLAHPLRLSLLCHLAGARELSAGELVARESANGSQSQISQYLAELRRLDLVTTRREGQAIHYRLTSSVAKAVIKTLARHYCK